MRKSGVFPLRTLFRLGGEWLMGVDLQLGGEAVVLSQTFMVSGQKQKGTSWNFYGSRKAGSLDFKLSTKPAKPTAGQRTLFTLDIREGGAPAAGLVPYLGAAAHVAAFSEGAKSFAHMHGESGGAPKSGSAKGGHGMHHAAQTVVSPPLSFSHTFPQAGNYRLWVQVKNGEAVLAVPFDLRVAP